MDKPSPHIHPDHQPFWDACNAGRLLVQKLPDGSLRFPPSRLAGGALLAQIDWQEVEPVGSIATFTEVHRGPTKAFKEDQPYIVALVDLEAGPRLMVNIRGAETVAIGQKVRIIFETAPSGQHFPQAEPA